MAHFDEKSKEHRSNGHYEIDGVEFMSIWTFKKEYLLDRNERAINEAEGDQLISSGVENHTCKTETGNSDKAHIYPIDDLVFFYADYGE